MSTHTPITKQMKPINYYIQLSEHASTAIDNLSKERLIEEAQSALYHLDTLNNFESCAVPFSRAQQAITFENYYGLKSKDDFISLAHGLLAKACAFPSV